MCASRCLAPENDCINCLEDYETQTSAPSCIFDTSSSTLGPLLRLMDDVWWGVAYVLATKLWVGMRQAHPCACLSSRACVSTLLSRASQGECWAGWSGCPFLIGATAPTTYALKGWRCPLLLIFARDLAGLTQKWPGSPLGMCAQTHSRKIVEKFVYGHLNTRARTLGDRNSQCKWKTRKCS